MVKNHRRKIVLQSRCDKKVVKGVSKYSSGKMIEAINKKWKNWMINMSLIEKKDTYNANHNIKYKHSSPRNK